jgi:hypothetical protein
MERVFGWSFLAEMLVGRYEGTRSPFFPSFLLPSFLPHLLTADMSNSYNGALVLPRNIISGSSESRMPHQLNHSPKQSPVSSPCYTLLSTYYTTTYTVGYTVVTSR